MPEPPGLRLSLLCLGPLPILLTSALSMAQHAAAAFLLLASRRPAGHSRTQTRISSAISDLVAAHTRNPNPHRSVRPTGPCGSGGRAAVETKGRRLVTRHAGRDRGGVRHSGLGLFLPARRTCRRPSRLLQPPCHLPSSASFRSTRHGHLAEFKPAPGSQHPHSNAGSLWR